MNHSGVVFGCVLLALTTSGAAQARTDPLAGFATRKVTGRATGFFHAQKIGGKWWLITPSGEGFFSKGVCHVSYVADTSPALGYSPYARATEKKYGSVGKWAEATAARLRKWGFNTAGAWSNPEMGKTGLAYAPVLDLAANAGRDVWLSGQFPDIYTQKFRDSVDATAREKCRPNAKDRNLLGYFTDNELHWGPDWRSQDSLLEVFLKLPADSPGHQQAVDFVHARGRLPGVLTPEDKDAFLEKLAGEYFRLCYEAIHRYDPNHMILGCRFAGYAPDPVLRALKPYVDVISYNNYDHTAPVEKLRHISEVTGKPVMITEFSFKAMDSGLPNTRGASEPVATQSDRANLFDAYVTALAKMPECVGFHWFEYCDEPKEGRFDGENSNYGLVKITDEPWTVLTDHMAKVNARLNEVHAGS